MNSIIGKGINILKKRILSLILVFALALMLLPITAFATEGDKNIAEECELFLDGDPGWRVYPVDSIDTALTLEQLNIVLKTNGGEVVDPSKYTLTIKVQTDWDDEHDCPITGDVDAPYGITGEENRQSGFQSYYAFVEATEGSGYCGDFTNEFIIWDKHSFNWFGATKDFGEQYKAQNTWSWHDYYRIPVGMIREPAVYSIDHNLVDPSEYTITYYRRNTDLPDFDDPEYQQKVFPEDDPLDGMPKEVGAYFAKIEAKDASSYYGTSYVDFDIVIPESFVTVRGSVRSFYEGDTIFIPENGSVWIWFDTEPHSDLLIAGWDPNSLKSFSMAQDPQFLDGEGMFVEISAEGLPVGTRETLEYYWCNSEDIAAHGWMGAEHIYPSSVDFEVGTEPDPQTFMFIKDESGRYYDGETATVCNGEELYVCFGLTYYPDHLFCNCNWDDLRDKGFDADDTPYRFGVDGCVYYKIRVDGVEAGTRAAIPYAWYESDDYSAEQSQPLYSGTIYIEAADSPEGYILGDADKDEKVTVLDATVIQKKLASIPVSSFNPPAADTNRNGSIDILDATNIQKFLAHLDISNKDDINQPGIYGTYYASWNMKEKLLPEGIKLSDEQAYEAQAEIRKALGLLFDRTVILDSISLERKPASSFVPGWITDADGSVFETNASQDVSFGYYDASQKAYAANRAAAIEILKKYYDYDEATGKFTNVPTLTYLFNQGDAHRTIGQTIKDSFEALGITLVLQEVGWGEYFDVIDSGEYSLCRNGWVEDFDDPMLFLPVWTSESEDNSAGLGRDSHGELRVYSLDLRPYGYDVVIENGTWRETYDTLIEIIEQCRNKENRYKMMHIAEDMLMDTGAVMPLYYY